jgi:hypothetical protein
MKRLLKSLLAIHLIFCGGMLSFSPFFVISQASSSVLHFESASLLSEISSENILYAKTPSGDILKRVQGSWGHRDFLVRFHQGKAMFLPLEKDHIGVVSRMNIPSFVFILPLFLLFFFIFVYKNKCEKKRQEKVSLLFCKKDRIKELLAVIARSMEYCISLPLKNVLFLLYPKNTSVCLFHMIRIFYCSIF